MLQLLLDASVELVKEIECLPWNHVFAVRDTVNSQEEIKTMCDF